MGFLDKVALCVKKYLTFFFLVMIGVKGVEVVLNVVFMATSGFSAWFIFSAFFSPLIMIGILVFGLFAHQRKNEELFKLFFAMFFGYLFINYALTCFDTFTDFVFGGGVNVTYGLFNFFSIGTAVAIGVLALIEIIFKKERFSIVINILFLAELFFLFVLWILLIVGVATGNFAWNTVFSPFFSAAAVCLFMGCYNYKKTAVFDDYSDVADEEESDNSEESSESVSDETVAEDPSEEVAEKEKPKKRKSTKKAK